MGEKKDATCQDLFEKIEVLHRVIGIIRDNIRMEGHLCREHGEASACRREEGFMADEHKYLESLMPAVKLFMKQCVPKKEVTE